MPPTKPTILILHGGWHLPAHYAPLAAALESRGYEVHVPRLPSTNGARPPNADLYADAALARSYASSLARGGRRLVVLMHSYGGQVGTEGLRGLGWVESSSCRGEQGEAGGGGGGGGGDGDGGGDGGGSIAHLVFLAANACLEGRSPMDKVAEMGHADLVPLVFDIDAGDGTCVHRDPRFMVRGPVGGDTGKEEEVGEEKQKLDEYVAGLVRWNSAGMYQSVTGRAAWRDVDTSYVYCLEDSTLPIEYQRSFVRGMEDEGREVKTFELRTGHCPNFSAVEGVVDVVERIVADGV